MQVKFKDISSAATKFSQRGAAAAPDYTKGATAAAQTWADHTAASGDNYVAGVQAAIGRQAFQKGVAKAGAGKYSAQVTAVGGSRYSDGISKAGPAWQKGFGPIAAAVAGTDIGPRGPRGSPANAQRSTNMAAAWRQAKLAAS